MKRSLFRSERGFTLVELMASVVILSVAIGAISQVFIGGTRLINKQTNQYDLRMGSRQLVTQIEKDVQSATSVDVYSDAVHIEEVRLFDDHYPPRNYKTYHFDNTTHKLELYQYDFSTSPPAVTSRVVVSNISTLSFAGLHLGSGNVATTLTNQTKVPVLVNFAEQNENLNISTTLSPRWNVGPGSPYLDSVSPDRLASGASVYQFSTNNWITITGKNTHFNADSVVTLQDGNKVFATSKPNGTNPSTHLPYNGLPWSDTALDANHNHLFTSEKLSNLTLWVVDSNNNVSNTALPFGYYDLYVTTPIDASHTEKVYKFSMLSCQWNVADWTPTTGQYNSGGWDDTNFPFVTKWQNNGNSNDKPNYYVPLHTVSDFDTVVGITLVDGGTTGSTPDAEITGWMTYNSGKSSYWGYGINGNKVFFRKVVDDHEVWSVAVSKDKDGKDLVKGGTALLEMRATNGTLDFYVGSTKVNDVFDLAGASVSGYSRTWTNPIPSGNLGVIVPGLGTVKFAIVRL